MFDTVETLGLILFTENTRARKMNTMNSTTDDNVYVLERTDGMFSHNSL